MTNESTTYRPLNVIEAGDCVRSFDLEKIENKDGSVLGRDCEGPHANYVVGVVMDITDPKTHAVFSDCARYEILKIRQVKAGKVENVDPASWCNPDEEGWESHCVYPPVNGTKTLFGTASFVERCPTYAATKNSSFASE